MSFIHSFLLHPSSTWLMGDLSGVCTRKRKDRKAKTKNLYRFCNSCPGILPLYRINVHIPSPGLAKLQAFSRSWDNELERLSQCREGQNIVQLPPKGAPLAPAGPFSPIKA